MLLFAVLRFAHSTISYVVYPIDRETYASTCRYLSIYPVLFFIQEIASHGCFSLGMIARFEPVLHEKGEWMYPRLFWETGILGQVLYLEAHAVGISATGIGCYFDDAGKLSYHFNSSIIVLYFVG
jgi:hypothetical protein